MVFDNMSLIQMMGFPPACSEMLSHKLCASGFSSGSAGGSVLDSTGPSEALPSMPGPGQMEKGSDQMEKGSDQMEKDMMERLRKKC